MTSRRLVNKLIDSSMQRATSTAVNEAATVRVGVVTAIDTTARTLTATVKGLSTDGLTVVDVPLRAIPYEKSYHPVVGETAWLVSQQSTTFAIGAHTSTGLYWDDLRTPATRAAVGANAPTLATIRDALMAYQFSDTVMQQLYFEVQLPHSWEEGTDIHPHIHWSPGNTTNTGTVRWGFEYSWSNAVNPPGNTFPASATVYVEQAGGGSAYQHQIASFGALSGTGKRVSSVLLCRVFRDAAHVNDTFVGGAFAISMDVHYQSRNSGTTNEFTTP